MSIRVSKHRLRCPKCGSFARVRNSERLTDTFQEGLAECVNVDCNSRWVIGIEFIRELETWRPKHPEPNADEDQLSLLT